MSIGVKIRPKRAGFGASKPTPIETLWHENVLILTPMPFMSESPVDCFTPRRGGGKRRISVSLLP